MPQTTLLVFQEASGISPLVDWLNTLEESEPKAFVKCIKRILRLQRDGFELRRPVADLLRNEAYELRAKRGRVNYRISNFFCGFIARNVACLSHGFIKKEAIISRSHAPQGNALPRRSASLFPSNPEPLA